jgi:hypothetical protein
LAVKKVFGRGLSRLLKNRVGTAEIVGSVMFLLILLFFFTNVYLWHDTATRQMDNVLSQKMNSLIEVTVDSDGLNVTNNGGVDVVLSRLWIITSVNHNFADLENGQEIWVHAGGTTELSWSGVTQFDSDGSFRVSGQTVYYDPAVGDTFKVLTTLGNTAACTFS